MTIITSLLTGVEYDTDIQRVSENQIVIFFGYAMRQSRYVVCRVEHTSIGYTYTMIDPDTYEYHTTETIMPLSQKHGIGYYYDDTAPEFMDSTQVALIMEEAERKRKEQEEKREAERERTEQLKAVGRKRMEQILPHGAKAIIVARLKQDDSDPMTDYFASHTVRTVIIGISTHTRDLFSEMRKCAAHFPHTSHLAEPNARYEHREKYSMGAGYYLGESKYYGWIVHKVVIHNRERFIEEFALTASDEENICLAPNIPATPSAEHIATPQGEFLIVDYSERAIAVFGDTRPLKAQLSAMGGRFNSHLNYEGERRAGWIFQRKCKEQLTALLGIGKE